MKSTKNFLTLKKLSKHSVKPKVFVGMSGGVDSSVSAYLLHEAGYDVTGVFIKTWTPDWMECNWRDERRDAIRVAAQIGIPLLTLDLESEYKKEVVDYMIGEYRIGHTPNPDVMCNKYIKFGAFYDYAIKNGADFIATGHYARNYEGKLAVGVDKNKDQSYFLWTLSKDILQHTIFPIGELKKDIVRDIAKAAGLIVADKKDSQGICFLGMVDMKEFLKHYIDVKPGDLLDEVGKIIGIHKGAILYTLGEYFSGYVIARDLTKNTVTVSNKRPEEIKAETLVKLVNINWILGEYPNPIKKYNARVRYRQESQSVRFIAISKEVAELKFDVTQVVDSGQSVVVYDGDICLGGGIVA